MTWREHAAPLIAAVIKKYGTTDLKLVRRKLREVYPYGERELHPYKIWCDEIKRQLKLPPYDKTKIHLSQERLEQEGQMRLF